MTCQGLRIFFEINWTIQSVGGFCGNQGPNLLYYLWMIRKPKYQQVFETLKEAILSGRYEAGQKLPSEADLLEEFATSRITVIRALHELQQRGLPKAAEGFPGKHSPTRIHRRSLLRLKNIVGRPKSGRRHERPRRP